MSNTRRCDKTTSNFGNISDRFRMGEEDKRNFEDYIRDPESFGIGDRFASDKIVFPDDPMLSSNEVAKPVAEARIQDKIVFPNDSSNSGGSHGKHRQ
ncbi:hypothetical protein QE152_g15756 [Popillia japonica]|uniref:Uncharacterized protein n=1 Tax=Popillia japonica TaxID=7064 RepID=A0AAW1L753_POPJA